MFFVVRSNDNFNFPLGLIKYIVIVVKWEASAVFRGEVLSGGDGVPREQVLQQSSEFSGEVG